MQPFVYNYLKQNPEQARFVRFNPIWYRYLTREPQRIQELEKASKTYYGQNFSQQIDKLDNHLQKANMLLSLANAMKE